MQNNLGYNNSLYILPFDHRSSFVKLFGFTDSTLTDEQKNTIKKAKNIIYKAFKKSLAVIPMDQAAILVDEEYGKEIIRDAKNHNYNLILTIEKSGQEIFECEYGQDFVSHIEKIKPHFIKALIKYKPNFDCSNLKTFSDYSHEKGYKFLLEVLTENKKKDELISAIKEIQNLGIEPDIWKTEGMEDEASYKDIVSHITGGGRTNVKLVILGRGENREAVEKWINAGKNVNGIIGFAIGRTTFLGPLNDFKNNIISEEKTIEIICDNFLHFYNLFVNRR